MPQSETITFAPPKRSSPPDLSAFRHRVAAAVDDGASKVRIDLDGVEVLDSPLIASLIAILRHARERAASVFLRAGRRQITDTLRVTALDKVFTVEDPSDRLVA